MPFLLCLMNMKGRAYMGESIKLDVGITPVVDKEAFKTVVAEMLTQAEKAGKKAGKEMAEGVASGAKEGVSEAGEITTKAMYSALKAQSAKIASATSKALSGGITINTNDATKGLNTLASETKKKMGYIQKEINGAFERINATDNLESKARGYNTITSALVRYKDLLSNTHTAFSAFGKDTPAFNLGIKNGDLLASINSLEQADTVIKRIQTDMRATSKAIKESTQAEKKAAVESATALSNVEVATQNAFKNKLMEDVLLSKLQISKNIKALGGNTGMTSEQASQEVQKILQNIADLKIGFDTLKKIDPKITGFKQSQPTALPSSGRSVKVTLSDATFNQEGRNSLLASLQNVLASETIKATGVKIDVAGLWDKIKSPESIAEYEKALNSVMASANVVQGASIAAVTDKSAEAKSALVAIKDQINDTVGATSKAFNANDMSGYIEGLKQIVTLHTEYKQANAGVGLQWNTSGVDASSLATTAADARNLIAAYDGLRTSEESIIALSKQLDDVESRYYTAEDAKNIQGMTEATKEYERLLTERNAKEKEYYANRKALQNDAITSGMMQNYDAPDVKKAFVIDYASTLAEFKTAIKEADANSKQMTGDLKSGMNAATQATKETTASVAETAKVAAEVGQAKISTVTTAPVAAKGIVSSTVVSASAATMASEVGSVEKVNAAIRLLTDNINIKTAAIEREATVMTVSSKTETGAVGKIISSIIRLKSEIQNIGTAKIGNVLDTSATPKDNKALIKSLSEIGKAVKQLNQISSNVKPIDFNTMFSGIQNIQTPTTEFVNGVTKMVQSIAALKAELAGVDLQVLQALKGVKSGAVSAATTTKGTILKANQGVYNNLNKLISSDALFATGIPADKIAEVVVQLNKYRDVMATVRNTKGDITPAQVDKLNRYRERIVGLTDSLKTFISIKDQFANAVNQVSVTTVTAGEQLRTMENAGIAAADRNALKSANNTMQHNTSTPKLLQTMYNRDFGRVSGLSALNNSMSSYIGNLRTLETALQEAQTLTERYTKANAELATSFSGLTGKFTNQKELNAYINKANTILNPTKSVHVDELRALQSEAPIILKTVSAYEAQNQKIQESINLLRAKIEAEKESYRKSEPKLSASAIDQKWQTDGTVAYQKAITELMQIQTGLTAMLPVAPDSVGGLTTNMTAQWTQAFTDITLKAQEFDGNIKGVMKSVSSNTTTSTEKMARNYADLAQKMTDYRMKNSKMMGNAEFARQFTDIFTQVNSGSGQTAANLASLTKQFRNLQAAVSSSGNTGRSAIDNLKYMFGRIGGNMIISTAIFRLRSAIKGLFTTVKELDTAMTKLKRVTNETDATYNRFLTSAGKTAQAVGAGLTDVVDAAAEFAKLGYSLDEAAKLSENALLFKNVADLDVQTAIADLVSAMKAFNIEAKDSIRIVDALNEVANHYSVDAAGLGTILKKASSTLAVSGDSMEQIIALGTAMNEILQDDDISGSTLKTLALRLRGAKTELEDAGESTEKMAESTSKLRAKIMALTSVGGKSGFDIMLDPENFKTTYDIMKGISTVWGDMSQIDQAALLELIAGKNRAQGTAALITNFAQAEASYATAMGASGSAAKENERWLKSIEGRLNRLTAAGQSFAKTAVDDDFIKEIVSGATSLLNVIEKIVSTIGAVPAILGAISATGVLLGRNLGVLTPFSQGGIKSFFKPNSETTKMPIATPEQVTALAYQYSVAASKEPFHVTGNAIADAANSVEHNKTIITTAFKAVTDTGKTANASLQEYAKTCQTTGQAITTSGYAKFLGTMGYTKGKSNVGEVMKQYNTIAAQTGKSTADIGLAQQQFANIIGESNAKLGTYLGNLKTGQATMRGYVGSLVAAKAASLGMQMATMALNSVMMIGVSFAISAIIKGIDSLIVTESEWAEKTEDACNKVAKAIDSISSLSSSTSKLKGEFASLAQGVDAFGNNVSLSSGQYEKYLDISNQLADLYPELVSWIDKEGNSLLNLSGSVTEVTKELTALEEAKKQTLREEAMSAIPTHVAGVQRKVDKLYKRDGDYELLAQQVPSMQDYYASVVAEIAPESSRTGTVSQILDMTTNTPEWLEQKEALLKAVESSAVQNLGYTREELLQMSMDKFASILTPLITKQNEQVRRLYTELMPDLQTYVAYEMYNDGVSADVSSMVQQIIGQFDFSQFKFENGIEDVSKYVRTTIVEPITNAKPEVQQALTELLKYKGTTNTGELKNVVESFINEQDINEELAVNLRILFNLEDANGDTLQGKMDRLFGSYKKAGGSSTQEATVPAEESAYSPELQQEFDAMTPERFNRFYDYALEGKANFDSLTDALNSFNNVVDTSGNTIDSYMERITDTQTEVKTLDEAFQKIANGEWSAEDALALFKDFPQLAEYGSNMGTLKDAIADLMKSDVRTLTSDLRAFADSLPSGAEKQKVETFIGLLNQLGSNASVQDLVARFESLSEAISSFSSMSDLLKNAQEELDSNGMFSAGTLSSMSETFPKMEQAIIEYLTGMRDAQSLMGELNNEYDLDTKRHARYLQEKFQYNEDYYEHCAFLESDFINNIKDNYGVDLTNCKTYAQAKIAILEQIGDVAKRVATVFTAGIANADNVDLTKYIDATTGETTEAYEALRSGTIGKTEAQIITLVQDIQKKYGEYLGEFDVGLAGIADTLTSASELDSADSSASDATDTWKEAADAELATLEHLNAMKLISTRQYYDGINRINDKYFRDHQDKYLADYRSMLEKARSIYIEMYNDELAEYKYQYDMKLITAIDYYNKMRELNDQYFKGNSSFDEEYKNNNVEILNGLKQAYVDSYEKEKKNLDHLRNMDVIDDKAYYFELEKLVEKYYKGRIEFAEEYKSAEEEIYQGLHDMKLQALQEEMDALQKTADKNKEALDIEKKRHEYFNAKYQKTERVYDESKGGWTWENNKQEELETRRAWDEALQEREIQAIQDLIDALEKNTYNLNYVDPTTGQLVQGEYLDLLSQDQYDRLYASTFGDGGIKRLVDGLTDMTSTIQRATDIVTMGANNTPISYFNVEKVIANDAEEFVASMSEFLNDANNRSVLIGK